jgi:hypothetical protein
MLTLFVSCQLKSVGTLDYNKLSFDTSSIVIFNWDTTKYRFPNNSDPLPLSQGDLSLIDSLLKNAIDSFNTNISPRLYEGFGKKFPLDSFIVQQKDYKYQFFPYNDVNGKNVVEIIGFTNDVPNWKREIVHGKLHYGFSRMYIKMNLSQKTCESLHTADFG